MTSGCQTFCLGSTWGVTCSSFLLRGVRGLDSSTTTSSVIWPAGTATTALGGAEAQQVSHVQSSRTLPQRLHNTTRTQDTPQHVGVLPNFVEDISTHNSEFC